MFDFETQLAGFLSGAQTKIDAYFAEQGYKNVKPPRLVAERANKYVKIYARDVHGDDVLESGSIWAFIEIETGTILKPAGVKAPAKGARGTIMQEDYGVSYVTRFGPAYLPKGRKSSK